MGLGNLVARWLGEDPAILEDNTTKNVPPHPHPAAALFGLGSIYALLL